jgi:hypothetical protein
VYIAALESLSSAIKIYDQQEDIADKSNENQMMIRAAALSAAYELYSEDQKLVLIEARGKIDSLKNNFTPTDYEAVKTLLESIIGLDI